MKKKFLTLFAVLALVGCDKPQQARGDTKIEEEALLKSFISFTVAMTYDQVCNKTDPKTRMDFSNKENVTLMSNQQMLSGRLGGLWHMRNPDKTIEEGTTHFLSMQQRVSAKAMKVFEEEGCNGQKALETAEAFKFYRDNHPSRVMEMMNEEIVTAGGSITPPKEFVEGAKQKLEAEQ